MIFVIVIFIQSTTIDQHLLFKHVFASIKDFWESLKETIKSETIEFSKAKNRGLSRDKVFNYK